MSPVTATATKPNQLPPKSVSGLPRTYYLGSHAQKSQSRRSASSRAGSTARATGKLAWTCTCVRNICSFSCEASRHKKLHTHKSCRALPPPPGLQPNPAKPHHTQQKQMFHHRSMIYPPPHRHPHTRKRTHAPPVLLAMLSAGLAVSLQDAEGGGGGGREKRHWRYNSRNQILNHQDTTHAHPCFVETFWVPNHWWSLSICWPGERSLSDPGPLSCVNSSSRASTSSCSSWPNAELSTSAGFGRFG